MVGNLRVAEVAAELLRADGLAELKYITAEFEPFSSGQRPDLLYSPNSGPNSGRFFVVEMRVELPARGRRLPDVGALIEHRAFVQEDLKDTYLYFGVATREAMVDIEDAALLAVEGVVILDGVSTGEELAKAIRRWSAHAEPPPWARET